MVTVALEGSVVVRRAAREDSAAAKAVVRAVYDEHGFGWDEGGYHADLDDVEAAYDAFWVAELDGRVVGCVGLASGKLELDGSDCSLERLYVLPGARGRGLGAALAGAVVAEARARGLAQLEIWSDKTLADAHRLYERLGASLVSERVNDDPDQSPEWGFVLPLRRPAEAG